MYLVDSLACSQPNSATPMPSSAVTSQDAYIAAVGSKFVNGNASLNALINALGGDAVPTGAGDAGIPTTGVFPWFGIPSRNGGGGIPLSIGPGGGGPLVFTAASTRCAAPPTVLPLATVFPNPAVRAPIAAPPPARPSPVPVVTPARPSSPVVAIPDPSGCSAANVCAGLRDGCFLSSQVSSAQLLACAQAGWGGNRNLYPAVLARGGAAGGQYLGTPQPNPPQYSGSGMGLFDSGMDFTGWGVPEYALAGLGLYAAYQVLFNVKREKRRRSVMRRMDFK